MAEGEWEEFQTVQTQNVFDLTISGNTAGALALVSSGTLTLDAGSNITLSQAGNAITIVGASAVAFDAGASTNASGTTGTVNKELIFFPGSNITLSESINAQSASITIIGAAAGTGGGIQGIVASNTTYTSGTVVFIGSDIITVKSGINQSVIIDATTSQSLQSYNIIAAGSQTANTTGTVLFQNSNGLSFGMSNNSVITASYTVPTQSIQSYNIIAAGTQTANTTGTVVFSDSNNVSFGMSNNSIITATATFSQSVQTQSIIQDVNITSNTAGVTADITSGTLMLAGGQSITLSQASNTITIVGASTSQSVQTQSIVRDIVIGGNTTGTTADMTSGTVTIAGGNSITISQAAGNAITISGRNAIRFVTETALTASALTLSISGFVSSNRMATVHVFVSNTVSNVNVFCYLYPVCGGTILNTNVQTRVGISQSDGGGPSGIGDTVNFEIAVACTQVGWAIANVFQTSNLVLYNGQVWRNIPGGGIYFPHNVCITDSRATTIQGFYLSATAGTMGPGTRLLLYVGEN